LVGTKENFATVSRLSPTPHEDSSPPSPLSSLERVKAKESFAPDEPLPAFTYPALEEDEKQELLRRVEAARSDLARAKTRPAPLSRHLTLGEISAALRRIGRDAWTRGSVLGHRWLAAACAVIDKNRWRLPERLRVPLSRLPAVNILAAFTAVALGAAFGAGQLGRNRTSTPPPASPPSAQSPIAAPSEDPVPHELERAKNEGPDAFEKLTVRFPTDRRVWLALAASHSAKSEHTAAVAAVGKALATDASSSHDTLASEVLARAVRKRPTSDSAFELLAGPMAADGATVLYDLSLDPEVGLPLRGRAEQWVRSEAFTEVAEPDVTIAGALRYARSCTDRRDLLSLAAEKGGRRVLDFLNVAKVPAGCGRSARTDCFPCPARGRRLEGRDRLYRKAARRCRSVIRSSNAGVSNSDWNFRDAGLGPFHAGSPP
jgi:hypothetical protein